MASIDARLAEAAEALKNIRGWLKERGRKQDEDHDTLLKLGVRVSAIEKALSEARALRRAALVAIIGAAASGILALIAAVVNLGKMLVTGAPE